MEIKEILDPKNLMIATGVMVIIMSILGMTNGDEWAAVGWGGEENVLAHDASYEEMWALHLDAFGSNGNRYWNICLGKRISKNVDVISSGNCNHFRRNGGYKPAIQAMGGDAPPIDMLAPALITFLLTLTLGVAGYMHKDGE